jgi:peptidoglycan/xylan/chitin deacetylase (PgdA/CDA1 family)
MPLVLGLDFEALAQTPAHRASDSTTTVDLGPPTERLLDLFATHDVSVTVFVVSELVEQYPDLLARVADEGHEIASHTRSHQSLPDVDDARRDQEIDGSKRDLTAALGAEVTGFRAPTCRIDDRTYRQVAAAGYDYSSSVMPSVPGPGFYSTGYTFTDPVTVETSAGPITEFPLATHPRLGLPLSGAWVRLLGRRYTLGGLESLAADRPVFTYSHPWEFVPISDRDLPVRLRIRTGDWLLSTYERLLELDVAFATARDVLAANPEPVGSYATTAVASSDTPGR